MSWRVKEERCTDTRGHWAAGARQPRLPVLDVCGCWKHLSDVLLCETARCRMLRGCHHLGKNMYPYTALGCKEVSECRHTGTEPASAGRLGR